MKKVSKIIRRRKTLAWYRAEIRRIDKLIDQIRYKRFYGGWHDNP